MVFHLKEPFATLLWNVSDGAIGIVPYGSGEEMSRHPIGSGPFRFVSAEPDKEVIIERNDGYWGAQAHLERIRFAVIPDATTRALELRKGSADIAVTSLTGDMVLALERESNLEVMHAPGTVLAYIAFNTAGSDSQRCARAAGIGVCDRSNADDSLYAAGFREAGLQPAPTGKLGLQRRRPALRSQS